MRHMTRWHSKSSGRTSLEQMGHLKPLKDQRCAGREWVVKTLPKPSVVRGPSSKYSSGELPSVSLPAPPPPPPAPPPALERRAGMVKGTFAVVSWTLDRDRARPRSPVRSLDDAPPPPWLAERRRPRPEPPSDSAVPALVERALDLGAAELEGPPAATPAPPPAVLALPPISIPGP